VPTLPSWLITPLWDQFCALLPEQGTYHPNHPHAAPDQPNHAYPRTLLVSWAEATAEVVDAACESGWL
jgi:hypothetical protein